MYYQTLFFLFFLFFSLNTFAQEKTDSIAYILTQDEKDWLALNPIIKVGVDKDYAPYEWLENGSYKGVAIDYWNKISNN